MTFRLVALIGFASALLLPPSSPAATDEEVLARRELEPASAAGGETLFERIPSSRSGVTVTYELDTEHPLRRLYPFGWATGNVAIGDVDGDGRADLFFPGTTGPHRLFIQKDDFRFEEVTTIAQLGGERGWGAAATMADVDNDGDLDIHVANVGFRSQLLMNITRGGVPRFTDMAKDYRVDLDTGALSASFEDFDRDGNLDLYLQTYHLEPEGGRPPEIEVRVVDGRAVLPEEWEDSYVAYLDNEGNPRWVEAPLRDRFLRNNGTGQFFPEPNSSLGSLRSYSVAHTWWDFDHDLAPDLHVAHDSHMPDVLFRNLGGRQLTEVSRTALPCTSWFARGSVAADFDGDLLVDFLSAGSAPRTHLARLRYGEPFRPDIFRVAESGGAMQVNRNTLFGNTGTSRFLEMARLAGLSHTGATWAVKAGDYDGDGLIDLFFANGEARDWTSLPSGSLVGDALAGKTRWDILAGQPPRPEPDLAFRNLGHWNFEETSAPWGLDFSGISYSAGQGDLDGDGDLDLVVCPLGEEVILYRNHSQHRRIVVDLEGGKTNRRGIGAELLARIGDRTVLRQLHPSGGFRNSDEPAFFLGLGEAETVDRLTIRWPASGAMTTLENLEAGSRYSIREAFSAVPAVTRKRVARPWFVGSRALAGIGHLEPEFDDYSVQPLLPPGLARTGPALAAQDLDGNGIAEFLIGGSRNVAPRFVATTEKQASIAASLAASAPQVDGGAVFFDANGDGATDLFIGSGALETGGDAPLARDRLYLGSESGFGAAPAGSIPEAFANSGPAAAVDFDRDGDVDLFVGSRFAPGAYPLPGRSRLLANDGSGAFTDATAEVAPGLESAGMVSSALWSDADGDGWIDLLLATRWGPVRFWKNVEGKLEDHTEAAGLATLTGLWNAITGGDIDGDGDIDYLVANEGLNSSLETSADRPAALLYGDFLDIGSPQVIETVREDGRLLPKLGWLDFSELRQDLLNDFESSADFVEKGLPLYFSAEKIAAADSLTATVLESGYLLNDGAGRFEFRPLPRIAQVGASYGAVLTDVNADGKVDAYLVQNEGSGTIRHPEPENGGISQLLLNGGTEEDRFVPVPPDTSGLVVFGAARGLVATDLNSDSRPDFVTTLRNNNPGVFLNQVESAETQPLKVRLDTPGKHPAGARVTVTMEGFPDQVAEYYAGGGFLSQSPAELFFAAPKKPAGPAEVTIRWADGTETSRKVRFE